MRVRQLLVLLVALILMTGCLGGGKQKAVPYAVSGRVVGPDGQGLSEVTLLLRGTDEQTVKTDQAGYWSAANLSGTVTITPADEEMEFYPLAVTVKSQHSELEFIGFPITTVDPGTEPYVRGRFFRRPSPVLLRAASVSPDNWDSHEVWLVPVVRGNDAFIKPGTVARYARKFPVFPTGEFMIKRSDLPERFSEFVLLLVNPTLPSRKEQIVAFVSFTLQDGVEAVVLPLDRIQAALNLGILLLDGNLARSTRTLTDNAGAFSAPDVEALVALANFTNFGKLVINDYVNYYDDYRHYSMSLILNYQAPRTKALEGTLTSDDFSSAGVTVFLFTPYRDQKLFLVV